METQSMICKRCQLGFKNKDELIHHMSKYHKAEFLQILKDVGL